jgi:hypothetical protein
VAGALDDFLWCHHLTLFYLAVKLSHVEGDVDGLACCLHWPTNYS